MFPPHWSLIRLCLKSMTPGMFFEVLNRDCRKGEIGYAASKDGLSWTYQHIVLAEPFHLSYPYVFEWENNYYMIPEANSTESIRLYRATNFPRQWEHVTELRRGRALCGYFNSPP